MKNYVREEEVGDYRITIKYDTRAKCPVKVWDMVGNFLWEDDCIHRLSKECNWKEVYQSEDISMECALRFLVEEHCDFNLFVKYLKEGDLDSTRLRYDRSARLWKLEVYHYWAYSKNWDLVEDIEPSELKGKEWGVFNNLFEYYGEETLLEILRECSGDNFFVTEWGTRGYSQGDYVNGIAFVTKERYDERCGRKDIPWKEGAQKCIDEEVECIGKWMWGDVLGYELEKKVRFKKVYEDADKEDKDDYEWEHLDSCWGYYMDADELIEEVLSEHNIKRDDAA